MKTVAIPKLLHEVFGKKTTPVELGLVLAFAVGMSVVLLLFTSEEWSHLNYWRLLGIVLLLVDINGGVIANFTWSTNRHYRANRAARLLFIGIHVQPILLALLFGDYYIPCLYVWVYTTIASLIVNALVHHPAQRTIGAVAASAGIAGLVLLAGSLPKILFITLIFFLLKVIFSFAVDHYAPREE